MEIVKIQSSQWSAAHFATWKKLMLSLNYGRFAYSNSAFLLASISVYFVSQLRYRSCHIKPIKVSQSIFTLQWDNLIALTLNEIDRLNSKHDAIKVHYINGPIKKCVRNVAFVIVTNSLTRNKQKEEKKKNGTAQKQRYRLPTTSLGYFWFARVYKQITNENKKMQICAEFFFFQHHIIVCNFEQSTIYSALDGVL